jgi:hypothetical protein
LERDRSNSSSQYSAPPMARTPSHRSSNSAGAIPIPLHRNPSNPYSSSYRSGFGTSPSFGGNGLTRTPSRLQRTVEVVEDTPHDFYVKTIANPLESTLGTGVPGLAITTTSSPPPQKRRRQDERKVSISRMAYVQRDRSDSSPLTPDLTVGSSGMSRQGGSIGSSFYGEVEMLRLNSNMDGSSDSYAMEQRSTNRSLSDQSDRTVLTGFGPGPGQPDSLLGIGGGVNTESPVINSLDPTLGFNGELPMAPEMDRSLSNISNVSNSSNRSLQRHREVLDNQKKTSLLPKKQSTSGDILGEGQSSAMTTKSKKSFRRSPRHPIWCLHCDPHRLDAKNYRFRGEHELKRHTRTRHDKKRTVWQAKDGTLDARRDGAGMPLIPLKDCKRCHIERKRYNIEYNLTSHLTRQHFHPEEKKGSKKGSEKVYKPGGWVPSAQVYKKYWVTSIEEEGTDADGNDHTHIDEDVSDLGVEDGNGLVMEGFSLEEPESKFPEFSSGNVLTDSFQQHLSPHPLFEPIFADLSPNSTPREGHESTMLFNDTQMASVYAESPSYLPHSSAATDNFNVTDVSNLDRTSPRYDVQIFDNEAENLFEMNDSFGTLDRSESLYHSFDHQPQAEAFPPF